MSAQSERERERESLALWTVGDDGVPGLFCGQARSGERGSEEREAGERECQRSSREGGCPARGSR